MKLYGSCKQLGYCDPKLCGLCAAIAGEGSKQDRHSAGQRRRHQPKLALTIDGPLRRNWWGGKQ